MPDEAPSQVGAVHKDAVHNLIFLKRQQWLLANYTVGANGAIIYVSINGDAGTLLLLFLAVLVTAGGIAMIWIMQGKMAVFRKRLHYIYLTYFGAEERASMMLNPSRPSFWLNSEIPIGLTIVCLSALLLLCFLLPA